MSEKKITGEFYGTSKEDEDEKLRHIRQVSQDKLEATRAAVKGLQTELHELQDVYDLDEKEGLAQWFNTDSRFQEVRKDLLRAERAVKKPYFGRIDIVDEESSKKETFYIGKTVVGEDPANPEVIDWRAPISSVYYDHSLGKCSYKVPTEGIFKVDLKRKRTYEIEGDKVVDFYDSDVVANDDLLTKYLSKSKRNVLSEIIATIQQEQNEVIRKNPRHNVLVQGSAGSGKTTVAMHRISYILYNYDTEFKPESFYIVGSNKVLLNYITGVLPDLDVYGVSQMTMEELFIRLLYEDWDKDKYAVRRFEKNEKNIGIKGSDKWFNALKNFCRQIEWHHIPKADIVIEKNNRVILSADDIKKAINEYPDHAMYQKFTRMNDLLMSKLENELYGKYYSYNVEEQKKITRQFKDYFYRYTWKDSVFKLYEDFVESQKKDFPDLFFAPSQLDLYDLASLAYIYKRIKESEVIQEASHVVIDEAQDFGMTVYRSLKYCMSKCTFTIMGDVSQNINFEAGLGDWEELKKVMLPDKYDFFGILKKSYRNTVEISKFATDVLRHGSFPIYPVEPIIRHGDEVVPVKCESNDELDSAVIKKLAEMKEKGYETIAVICKNSSEAATVYESIKNRSDAKLFSDKDAEFTSGSVVLPIEYSKGLEFDAVIIYDASATSYPKEDGYAKLLYVAATRALHELAVFYTGKLTGLIKDPIPENRKNETFAEDSFHKKPFKYEEEFKTKEEIAKEQALEGDRERALRNMYGPKRIVVNTKPSEDRPVARPKAVAKTPQVNKPVASINLKPTETPLVKSRIAYDRPVTVDMEGKSEYGTMPTGQLSPAGHGKIDVSLRWVSHDKKCVEMTSTYGVLRITPISDETVRVSFAKASPGGIRPLPSEVAPKQGLKWLYKESRDAVEIGLEKLTVKVEKKNGAVQFFGKNGNLLLAEKTDVPRQFHGTKDIWWEYFNWGKNEKLGIRGAQDVDWTPIDKTARYISHGEESSRPALIMSSNGYQILVPGGIKTLLCTIPAYGPYLSLENTTAIDYIFRAAK